MRIEALILIMLISIFSSAIFWKLFFYFNIPKKFIYFIINHVCARFFPNKFRNFDFCFRYGFRQRSESFYTETRRLCEQINICLQSQIEIIKSTLNIFTTKDNTSNC